MALAYFITFSTYGTWLHGTGKGLGSVDRKHNAYGADYVAPDDQRVDDVRDLMTQPPYIMNEQERQIVCDAMVQFAIAKSWLLHAVHVRSNHVHVVITAERDPDRLLSDLKARASWALTKAGFGDKDRKRWTRHGSTLHLFHDADVTQKIDYTLHGQGTPMARYPN